jgi:hypothetical protein
VIEDPDGFEGISPEKTDEMEAVGREGVVEVGGHLLANQHTIRLYTSRPRGTARTLGGSPVLRCGRGSDASSLKLSNESLSC